MTREECEKLLDEHDNISWEKREVYPLLRGHHDKQADALKKRYDEIREQIITAMHEDEI